MLSSDELFRNKSKIMCYELDKLYYGTVDEEDCLIYEKIVNHQLKYIQLLILPNYAPVDRVLNNNFKIIKSLKEEVKNKDINLCLLHNYGEEKRNLTIEEIICLTKLITQLNARTYDELNDVCSSIVEAVVKQLKINVINQDILNDEIVISAPRLNKFKNILFNYIKISLILDGKITLDSNDYRIQRALKSSKIRKPNVEKFNISCIDYKITLNGEETTNYQRTFKYKKYLTNIK